MSLWSHPAGSTQAFFDDPNQGFESLYHGDATIADHGGGGQGPGAPAGPTPEERERERQRLRNEWIQAFTGKVGAWQAGRAPYADAIHDRTFQAGQQQIQIANRDAMRANRYEMYRRGTQGSTIDASSRGKIAAATAGELARLDDNSTKLADAQRVADMDAAQQLRLLAQQYQPGDQFLGGTNLQEIEDQAKFEALLAQAAQLAYAGRMQNEQLQSQIYGSMIATAGQGAKSGSRSGFGMGGSMGGSMGGGG